MGGEQGGDGFRTAVGKGGGEEEDSGKDGQEGCALLVSSSFSFFLSLFVSESSLVVVWDVRNRRI